MAHLRLAPKNMLHIKSTKIWWNTKEANEKNKELHQTNP